MGGVGDAASGSSRVVDGVGVATGGRSPDPACCTVVGVGELGAVNVIDGLAVLVDELAVSGPEAVAATANHASGGSTTAALRALSSRRGCFTCEGYPRKGPVKPARAYWWMRRVRRAATGGVDGLSSRPVGLSSTRNPP